MNRVLAKRTDFFEIGSGLKKFKTDQGFLRAPITATRVGVLEYIMPDGSVRRELRPPEEVFKADSLASLSNIPITNDHPMDSVTPENASSVTVGTTGDKAEIKNDQFVEVVGTIFDAGTIQQIEHGKHEVSCGYLAEIEIKSGVYKGQKYDAIQKDIVYNHVAVVDRGRAGENVKIRLDSNEAIMKDGPFNSDSIVKNDKGDNMKKITIGDSTFEVEDGLKAAFDSFMADLKKKDADKKDEKKDAFEAAVAELTSSKDRAEAKADALAQEIETLKEKLTTAETKSDSAAILKAAQELTATRETAEKILGDAVEKKEIKLDGMDVLEIKKAVLSEVSQDLDLSEKSVDYIEARFDAVAENAEFHKDALAEGLKTHEAKKDAKAKADAEPKMDAIQKAKEQAENAWKQPLTLSKQN